jgi:hypothetical protein
MKISRRNFLGTAGTALGYAALGLPQTPPSQALADALEWFRANGYARK